MITMHLFFEHVLIPGIPPMPVDVDDARAYKCGVGNRMFHSVVGIGVEGSIQTQLYAQMLWRKTMAMHTDRVCSGR